MSDCKFDIWQDGMIVASVSSSDPDAAMREAWHYAMVYGQDGPVQIHGECSDKLFHVLSPEVLKRASETKMPDPE